MSQDLFVKYFSKVYDRLHSQAADNPPLPTLDGLQTDPSTPGYPGTLALVGLLMLHEEGAQWAIVETGVGGQSDSTNVIGCPVATGITRLGYDHIVELGPNLENIA